MSQIGYLNVIGRNKFAYFVIINFLTFHILKVKNISHLQCKTQSKVWKASYPLGNLKKYKIALFCGNKASYHQNILVIFIAWIVFIRLEQKAKCEWHEKTFKFF